MKTIAQSTPSPFLPLAGCGLALAAGLVLYWSVPVMFQYGYPLVLDTFPWTAGFILAPPPLRLPDYLVAHHFYYLVVLLLAAAYIGAILALLRRAPQDSPAGRQEARRLTGLILAGSFIFHVLLFFLPGFLSQDIFVYVSLGRIQALYGANPYAAAPIEFPHDPTLAHVGVPEYKAVYGPLWVGITRLVVAASGDSLIGNLLGMKLVISLANLLCILLLLAISRNSPPAARVTGLLLYAWNPLILVEVAGNGHNDVLVLLCLLAGGYLLGRRAPMAAWACVVAAGLVKLTGFLFWPVFLAILLRRNRGAANMIFMAGLLMIVAAVMLIAGFAPYWVGLQTLAPTLSMANLYTNSLLMSLNHWLQVGAGMLTSWPPELTGARVHLFLNLFMKLVFLIYLGAKVYHSRFEQDLWDGWRDTYLFFVLFVMQYYWPWYLVPLVGVAAAGPWRPRAWPVYLFSLSSFFIYGFIWSRKLPIPGRFWRIALIYLAAAGAWLAGIAVEKKRPERGSA